MIHADAAKSPPEITAVLSLVEATAVAIIIPCVGVTRTVSRATPLCKTSSDLNVIVSVSLAVNSIEKLTSSQPSSNIWI